MKSLDFLNEQDVPFDKCKTLPKELNNEPNIKRIKVYTFEEAVALTEVGIFHYILQIVCGLCLISATIDVTSSSIVMPFLNQDIPPTVSQQGLYASSGFLGTVVSSYAIGFLCDTWGRVKMLRTTISVSFISAFSVNIWMLIVFRFLTGMVMSGCQAIVFNFVGEFHSNVKRARYVTMLSTFKTMALMIIPALGLGILPLNLNWTIFGMEFHSWRLFMLVISFLKVFALIGILLTPESPKYVLMQGDHEQAIRTLRKMFMRNTHKRDYEYPVQQISIDKSGGSLKNITGVKDAFKLIGTQTAPLFSKNRALHTINICFIMFVMSAISHGAFMWLPTILNQLADKSGIGHTSCQIMYMAKNATTTGNFTDVNSDDIPVDTTMFIVLIIIGAVFTVIYFILSSIVNFVGKRRLFFCWIMVAAVGCLIFQYVTDFTWSVVVFTLMSSLNSSSGIISTVAIEFFPTNVSAMGMCLVMMIGRIGSFAGSNFVGLMIYTHCEMLFTIYMGLCIMIACLSLLLPSNSKETQQIHDLE